jgi:HAD superfamily hydrolase (TIGR01459 family)
MAPQRVAGVQEVASSYAAILLDQFGVLHDGRNAYTHALTAVEQLHRAGKHLIVLSNSGRRAAETTEKLARLGFNKEHFTGAVTSGETTHEALSTRADPLFASLGRRCLNINWADRGATPIDVDSYGIELVQDVDEADFILAHGMEALSAAEPRRVTLEELQALLRKAAERSLPLIIANPDVVTVDTTFLVPMPGQLGVWYEAMPGHGDIVLMGKPAARIYDAAKRVLPDGAGGGRILAVGDSLAHDVKGACAAGIDSLFVVHGIHKDELTPWSEDALRRLANEHCDGHMPTFIVDDFSW